jgi:hypothetical protein
VFDKGKESFRLAKYYFRGAERVKCPHNPDTRHELAVYAMGSREKIREFRLQMAYFEENPAGAPPIEARVGALREYAAGLRANYLELRRKMEKFDLDFLNGFERHIARLAAGDYSSKLTVAGRPLSELGKRPRAAAPPSRSRARPPWAKRGRR